MMGDKGLAFIFDLDGVLANTMAASFAAYRQALAEVDVPIDEQEYYAQAGMTGREQIKHFATKAGMIVDLDQVYERTREIRRKDPQPTEGIDCNLELLRILRNAGVPIAVATGSSRLSAVPILTEHGIEVDAIITAEDVQRGKPFPDLFLRAAEKLAVPPNVCIVVEDSEAGIAAAQAAGMKAMRFYNGGIKRS